MKTNPKGLRQGDVGLRRSAIPENAKKIKVRPLAYGEITGHHHSFAAAPGVCIDDALEMFEVETGEGVKTYVRITGDGISLVHQDHFGHGSDILAPGAEFIYVPQVENSDWGTRPVVD